MPDWSWVRAAWNWIGLVPEWMWGIPVGVVVYWANNYIAPYWKERRKRKAQSESHADFIKVAEEIKSDIGMLREESISVRIRGDKALIEFFENCRTLLGKLILLPYIQSVDVRKDLDKLRQFVIKILNDIRLSQMSLLIYFHGDDKLVKQSEKIVLACTEFIHIFNKYFPSMDPEIVNHLHEFINQQEAHDMLIDETNQKIRKYNEAMKAPLENFRHVFYEYVKGMSAYFGSKYQGS